MNEQQLQTQRRMLEHLSASEGHLIAEMGVYGIWLLRYCKNYTKDDPKVQGIVNAYSKYLGAPMRCGGRPAEERLVMAPSKEQYALVVMREIDKFCEVENHPRPGTDYETALKELLDDRRKESASDRNPS